MAAVWTQQALFNAGAVMVVQNPPLDNATPSQEHSYKLEQERVMHVHSMDLRSNAGAVEMDLGSLMLVNALLPKKAP